MLSLGLCSLKVLPIGSIAMRLCNPFLWDFMSNSSATNIDPFYLFLALLSLRIIDNVFLIVMPIDTRFALIPFQKMQILLMLILMLMLIFLWFLYETFKLFDICSLILMMLVLLFIRM